MENAALTSMVGMIADYKAAINDGINGTTNSTLGPINTMAEAQAALSAISNKSDDVEVDVVNAVNDILGEKDASFDASGLTD